MNSKTNPVILEMKGITKEFSGFKALDNVNLTLYEGEVHALMGENGAGKSTLMKILSGVYQPDKGTIFYNNKETKWINPQDARNKGISIIHQELNLSPNISVAENIFMGSPLPKRKSGIINWKEMYQKADEVLNKIGANINAKVLVSTLSVAQQQMVEIARALLLKSKVLVMDEPTATLTDREIEKLFILVKELKKQGTAIVYISHRMDEIFEISDRCTVLRDGAFVKSMSIGETNPDDLIRLMVGRELTQLYHTKSDDHISSQDAKPVLEIKNISDSKVLKNVHLELYPGEILGIAGLVGAGRTELIRAIFGANKKTEGEILLEGKKVKIDHPLKAISYGIAHVPESRKEQGLFLDMSVKENIIFSIIKQLSTSGFVKWSAINRSAQDAIKRLNIKAASPDQLIRNLSGGNQQKALIARWLAIHPKVLLLDEPTRGVDIGAKTEIYQIIHELADEGIGILMVSSELPELLGVCHRIMVMHEGRITGEVLKEEATQEKIMHYATGGGRL